MYPSPDYQLVTALDERSRMIWNVRFTFREVVVCPLPIVYALRKAELSLACYIVPTC